MTHFIKACQRLATDALGWAVGQFQLRVIQPMLRARGTICRIRHRVRWARLGVVFVGVAVEEVGQVFDTLCGWIHVNRIEFSDGLMIEAV